MQQFTKEHYPVPSFCMSMENAHYRLKIASLFLCQKLYQKTQEITDWCRQRQVMWNVKNENDWIKDTAESQITCWQAQIMYILYILVTLLRIIIAVNEQMNTLLCWRIVCDIISIDDTDSVMQYHERLIKEMSVIVVSHRKQLLFVITHCGCRWFIQLCTSYFD